MYSYYRTWGWRLQYDYLANLPSYSQFRLAWMAFSQLNVIPGSMFRCDECGSEPTVIVCDGICLSYPKRYSQTSSNSVKTSTTKLKGSRLVYRLNVSCSLSSFMGVLGNGIIVLCSSFQFVRCFLWSIGHCFSIENVVWLLAAKSIVIFETKIWSSCQKISGLLIAGNDIIIATTPFNATVSQCPCFIKWSV